MDRPWKIWGTIIETGLGTIVTVRASSDSEARENAARMGIRVVEVEQLEDEPIKYIPDGSVYESRSGKDKDAPYPGQLTFYTNERFIHVIRRTNFSVGDSSSQSGIEVCGGSHDIRSPIPGGDYRYEDIEEKDITEHVLTCLKLSRDEDHRVGIQSKVDEFLSTPRYRPPVM